MRFAILLPRRFSSAQMTLLLVLLQDLLYLRIKPTVDLLERIRDVLMYRAFAYAKDLRSLLYGPTLTSIHDYWKSHSFDYMDLCQQSNVSETTLVPLPISKRHIFSLLGPSDRSCFSI